jgi:hypothetical protein
MMKEPMTDEAAVATMRSRRTRDTQAAYPGSTGGNLQRGDGTWQSSTVHVPPESERMEAFTARMYAMVRNVAVPARSSVVKVVPRAARQKRRPNQDRWTAALSRPSFVVAASSPLLPIIGMMGLAMAASGASVRGCGIAQVGIF